MFSCKQPFFVVFILLVVVFSFEANGLYNWTERESPYDCLEFGPKEAAQCVDKYNEEQKRVASDETGDLRCCLFAQLQSCVWRDLEPLCGERVSQVVDAVVRVINKV